MGNEIWKPCYADANYEVSNLARFRARERVVRCGPAPGTRTLPAQMIKPVKLNSGYWQVQVSGKKKVLLHRAVAMAFVDGDTTLVVNHKNGDRSDTRPENLEWVTQGENNAHAFRVLGRKAPSEGKFGLAHPCAKPLTLHGVTKSAADWAADRGWNVNTIYDRVRKGWSVERILTEPSRSRA